MDPIQVFWMFVIFVALFLYFLPAMVASHRSHHQAGAVFMLNLFLGWTFLGWVVAAIWSVSSTEGKNKPAPQAAPASGTYTELKKCPWCAEDIKQEAVVCKHCNKFVEEDPPKNIALFND